MAAIDAVDRYIAGLPGESRRLARAEWGVTVAAGGAGETPLDIGVRVVDGVLRAQAFAVAATGALDPWLLLNWNRQTRYVRFGCARNGDVWVHGDIPVAAVDERAVDRLLGLVAEAATVVRRYAAEAPPLEDAAGGGA